MTRDRRRTFSLVLIVALLALGAVFVRARDVVLYNSSASVPVGFYVRTSVPPALGAFVTVRARDVAPGYAHLRHFTDDGDRFIKRVAAASGDAVCASGETITINGRRVAVRMTEDGQGRTLPTWSGCRFLQDEVFLLGDSADSFDARYWGPVSTSDIEGVWRLLSLQTTHDAELTQTTQ